MAVASTALVPIGLIGAAFAWWFVAPSMAFASDRRLPDRNPDHAKRILRFYRMWGLLAIGVGAVLAFAL